CNAVRLVIRYDTKGKDGTTRRERNERFGQDSPELEIDPVAEYLWEWFWDASRGRQAGLNGPLPLSGTEWRAWQEITGHVVRPEEWAILRDMDAAYLEACGEELKPGA